MTDIRYDVLMDGIMIARNMIPEYALVLAKALMMEYDREGLECGLSVTVRYSGHEEVTGDA